METLLSSEFIRLCAQEVGFDDCGVARTERLDADAAFMEQWVSQGLHGNMSYLERNREKRYDPGELVPGATAVVVCVLHYDKCKRDYHRTIKSMLYRLDALLGSGQAGEAVGDGGEESAGVQHIFCDSAPFLERRWAVKAGLGFIGRNHQFFHHTLGSMVHMGEIVLRVPVDMTADTRLYDGCPADCHLCEEACPTGALRNPVWDATQCIAYTTHHCLVCQQACPLNSAQSIGIP